METLIIVILSLAAVAILVRVIYSTVLGAVFTWIALRQLPKTASEFQKMQINEQLETLIKLKELGKLNQMQSYQGSLDASQQNELREIASQQGIDIGV